MTHCFKNLKTLNLRDQTFPRNENFYIYISDISTPMYTFLKITHCAEDYKGVRINKFDLKINLQCVV